MYNRFQSEHALCLNHVIILFSSVINLPGVSVALTVARVPVAIKGHGDILIFAVWSWKPVDKSKLSLKVSLLCSIPS